MGMTIEKALKIIKDGHIVATIIKGNNEDDTKFNQENIEALNTIVVTMRKYQKIETIIEMWKEDRKRFTLGDNGSKDEYLRQISEVIEDGK